MINASNEFKHLLLGEDRRNYLEYADITLTDGTELHLTNADFWQGGMEIEDAVSSDNSFDVGAAIINKCTLVIENLDDRFSEYEFAGARVVPYIGLELPGGTVEKICKGTFTVDEPKYNGSIITLECLDNMAKFDRPYSESDFLYPATLDQIVSDACSCCGVLLQTYDIPHGDFLVQQKPSEESTTFREVIAWAAQIAGCFARCDTRGRLELKWYDQKALESPVIVDWSQESPENASDENAHWIHSNYSSPVTSLDDVVITGVRVVEKNESEDSKEELVTYQAGKDGYVVSVEDNELIKSGAGQTVAGWLGEQLIGVRFRKAQANHASNPLMEAGDIAVLTDRKGNNYNMPASYTKFSTGSAQNTESRAQEPARNSAARFSAQTKNYVEWRKAVQQEKTQRELAIQGLSERLNNVSGVYTTVEQAEGGGSVFYLHNKPQLEESDMVWKMTAEAWGVSTDGMQTWNAGMTVDGNTIVRILTAVGVDADWINAGRIEVKDDHGDTLFLVDIDTGEVVISGDYIRIGTKNVAQALADSLAEAKSYSDGKISDYANIVAGSIESLQEQIDGQIETFYYDYEPSLENVPASGWKDETEKQKHQGDLFYDKRTGYAYRFFKDGDEWKWQLIQDNDITKAMQTAENAQDTADHKRRVFVSTPTPPYDIGDLWVNGADILTAMSIRSKGGIFVSDDWQKLNKYTDDTVANQALEEARKSTNLTIILDNEYQGIPTDSAGNYSGTLDAKTVVQTYYGHTNVSASCTYTQETSAGVTGEWDGITRTYTVMKLTTDTGWVDITASYMNLFTVTKRFNVAKVRAGAAGTSVTIKSTSITYQASSSGTTIPTTGTWSDTVPTVANGQYLWTKTEVTYSNGTKTTAYSVAYKGTNGEDGKAGRTYFIELSATSLKRGANKKISPTTITASGFYRDGQATSRAQYIGRWEISYLESNGIAGNVIETFSDTASYALNVENLKENYVAVQFTLYAAGGNTQILNSVTVPVIDDGESGRTYFMEPSTLIVKRSANDAMAPNYITLSAYYRDGTNTARTAYSGRFKIEESLDGDKWTTVYTSASDETAVTHSLYGALATSAGGAISSASGKSIGIPRDVVAIRCTLYAEGGTTQMLDMQTIAVVIDVDALTHEEIFKLLTNDGAMKGIYQEGNQLYISFTYAKGGELVLGGKNNGNGRLSIRNVDDEEVGYIDNAGVHFNQGNFTGTIEGSHIHGSYIDSIGEDDYSETSIDISDGEIRFLRKNGGSYDTCGIIRNGDILYGNDIKSLAICAPSNVPEYTLTEAAIAVLSNLIEFTLPVNFYENVDFFKEAAFEDSVTVYKLKSRRINTENYGNRLQYCYEMPSPMFGDIGEAFTDETGECYVYLDDIFSETVSPQIEYQVFLQKEGEGDLWISQKESTFFVVKGTPNLKFSWEIKAKQKDYEYERMEVYEKKEKEVVIDYERQYIEEITSLIREQEEILYEES